MPALLFSLAIGCAAPSQERATVLSPGPTPVLTPAPVGAPPLPPELEALKEELRAHAQHLTHDLGERSVDRPWELADAADYVATEWERMGYTIERQGYDVGEVVAQNLEVSVSGSDLGRESIIVGAHYDSPKAGTGVDTATGVAALLALSRALHDVAPRRRLRFVAYALGEAPHFKRESMGSLRHAREVAAKGDRVSLMINLDSLGHFSDARASQQGMTGIDVPLPTIGNFLLLLGSEAAETSSRALSTSCATEPTLELVARSYREGDADPALAADDWPYRQSGVPALLISDTKTLRAGSAAPRSPEVDWVRLTRFVSCLIAGLEGLADAAPAPGDPESGPETD